MTERRCGPNIMVYGPHREVDHRQSKIFAMGDPAGPSQRMRGMNGVMPLRCATIPVGSNHSTACRILASGQRRPAVRSRVQDTGTTDKDAERRHDSDSARSGGMNHLLLAVAEKEDRQAFQTLFEYFAPRVKAFLFKQGTTPEMAEEVVQETMVNVWRKSAQFDPARASASTWIFTIARNLRIDMLRKENRPAPDLDDPALVPDPEPAAHDAIAREQEADRLKSAVAALPQEQQEVLELAFFQEKAHPQVAEELGIPLGTVKSRIRLAFRRIRSELGETR